MKKNGKKAAPGKTPAAPRKSFREERYEEKKDAIMRIASKAFAKKGIDAVNMEEIANEIRMSKGSLYYYFKTKEELAYAAHLVSVKEAIERLTKIIDTPDPPDVKLKNVVRAHLMLYAREFEGAFVLQQEYALPEPYRKEIVALRDFYQSHFEGILREGVKMGMFTIKNLKVASLCMLSTLNAFVRWYSSSGSLSADVIADATADFFLKGILTRTGEGEEKEHAPKESSDRRRRVAAPAKGATVKKRVAVRDPSS